MLCLGPVGWFEAALIGGAGVANAVAGIKRGQDCVKQAAKNEEECKKEVADREGEVQRAKEEFDEKELIRYVRGYELLPLCDPFSN